MSSSVGMALICACHRFGWAVAAGRFALDHRRPASYLRERGGAIETGVRVRSLSELPDADAVVLDLAPGGVAEIAGDPPSARVARSYRRYRHGPGAFKVDLAVQGGVPWTNEACRSAGTVHCIGPSRAGRHERTTNRADAGRPFVLVGQQYLADPQLARRATCTRSGPAPMSQPLPPVTPRARSSTRSAGLREAHRRHPRQLDHADRSGQRELPRRRHHHRRQRRPAGRDRPASRSTPTPTGIRGVFICSAATPPGMTPTA